MNLLPILPLIIIISLKYILIKFNLFFFFFFWGLKNFLIKIFFFLFFYLKKIFFKINN